MREEEEGEKRTKRLRRGIMKDDNGRERLGVRPEQRKTPC